MRIVQALTLPEVPTAKTRIPRVDLGDLRVALGTGSQRFAISLIDPSGRLAQSALFRYLGWAPGEPLSSLLGGSCVQFVRDQAGPLSLDPRMRLPLPATTLRQCRVAAGDRVLMIAIADYSSLVVHPMANLAHMVRTFHADLAISRRSRTQ
ncbi:hypothetical protein [Actinokineospora cianjurensis]|nr:hypothetical protein [Actinokineospora cianjurensis]